MNRKSSDILYVLTTTLLLFVASCSNTDSKAASFLSSIKQSNNVTVLEGLPHQGFQKQLFEKEKVSKPISEILKYPFYKEELAISKNDLNMIVGVLKSSESYEEFSGGKKCGGFHPDYLVTFLVNNKKYHVLICFGCSEFKLTGPSIESRHDINSNANETLIKHLQHYRKNRPAAKS